MANIGTVQGYLKLTDDFTAVLDRAMGALGKSTTLMQNNLAQMQAALDMTATASKKMGAAAKKAGDDAEVGGKKAKASAGMWHDLRAAYAVTAIAIWQFIDRTVAAQQASDRMRNSLLAGTGDMQVVGQELAFIREEASRLGLDLATAGVQYGKLTAASKGTGIALGDVRAIFTAVAEAATALGLSSEDTTGALNAVVQMMTKGTVQAEELRGQLGDRVPGAVQAMARALGVGNGKLMEMLEQGRIITAEVLPRFAEELRKIGGSGVEAGAQSFNAELNRLKTSLFDLFAGISSSSALPSLVKSFRELVTVLDEIANSKGGSSFFSGLAQSVAEVIEGVQDLKQLLAGDGGVEADLVGIAGATAQMTNPIKQLLNALHSGLNATESDWEALTNEVRSGDTGVLPAFLEVMTGLRDRTREAKSALEGLKTAAGSSNTALATTGPDFVGPVRLSDLERSNRAAVDSTKQLLDKMTKDVNKYGKEFAAAFDLEDKLKNQSQELAIFQKLLKENGGDFVLAKKNAKSYYDVLKAGLDPLKGWGKALYEMAANNDVVEASLERQKKEMADYEANVIKLAKAFDKDLADAHKGALADVTKFGKAMVDAMGAMAKFRSDIGDYWGRLEASSRGADALREFNKEAEINAEILQRLGQRTADNAAMYDMYAAEIRESLGPLIDHRNWVEKTISTYEGMADVLNNTDWGSDKMNDLASGLGQVMSAMGKLRTATKLFSQESAQAWASMLNGINAVLEASGAFQTGNGGGFGGTPEGNYAAEGAMVGAIVGGIIGAFVGSPQAGMAIGSAAGGMLGGFIKKGAEEAMAELTINTAGFITTVNKAEGELGSSINQLGTNIATALTDIIGAIGGTMVSMPQVEMKIRDGVIGVLIGGVKAKFKEMDDAISFAVAELLKQGDIIGIDEMLRNALQNTSAASLEGLSRDLDAVMKVLSFGLTDSQNAIQGFTNELDGLRAQMFRLLSDSEQLAKAMSNLNQEEIRRWQTSRDAITGDKRSNAEKLEMLKRDGEMWNAEKAMRIAELQMKRDSLLAQNQMMQAEVQIRATGTDSEVQWLRDRSDLLGAESEMFNGFMAAQVGTLQVAGSVLETYMAALDDLIAALAAMPDIDVPNLHLPNVGGGHGGGGNFDEGPTEEERAQEEFAAWLADLQEQLRQASIEGGQYAQALDAIQQQLYQNMARAGDNEEARVAAYDLYMRQLDELTNEALGSLGLESVDLSNRMDELANTLQFLREQGALTDDQLKELGDQLFADVLSQMASAIGDSKTLAMLEEIRYDAMKMNARIEIERLALMGAISKEQYEYLLNYLDRLPDDLPEQGGGSGGGSHGGGQTHTDPTDTLLDQLIASINDLRNTLASYQNFLTSLERGPLSGATLQQQFDSAQSDFMQMLAAAQGGDMQAIRDLPGMAEEFLSIAAQYMDPSSSAYQQLLAMVRGSMGGIAGGIEDIINAAPESALGSNGVLDTIQQILAAMASRWGVHPGWNTGNLVSGGFQWNHGNGVSGGNGGHDTHGNSNNPSLVTSPALERVIREEIRAMRNDLVVELQGVNMVGQKQLIETREASLRRNVSGGYPLSSDRAS